MPIKPRINYNYSKGVNQGYIQIKAKSRSPSMKAQLHTSGTLLSLGLRPAPRQLLLSLVVVPRAGTSERLESLAVTGLHLHQQPLLGSLHGLRPYHRVPSLNFSLTSSILSILLHWGCTFTNGLAWSQAPASAALHAPSMPSKPYHLIDSYIIKFSCQYKE